MNYIFVNWCYQETSYYGRLAAIFRSLPSSIVNLAPVLVQVLLVHWFRGYWFIGSGVTSSLVQGLLVHCFIIDYWSIPRELYIGSWYVTHPNPNLPTHPPRTLPSWIIKANPSCIIYWQFHLKYYLYDMIMLPLLSSKDLLLALFSITSTIS